MINKVEPRFGSPLMAYAWYRSEPLPGFSGRLPCNSYATAAWTKCSTMSTLSTLACTPEGVEHPGKLYRALNPVYARQPLSGRGAELYGGRFNPNDMPALYASLSAMTALREANQVGNLQPTTLVSYDAEIDGLFDCRDDLALMAEGVVAAALADRTWRDQMKATGEAKTQAFARWLIARGCNGLLVRSFATGATEDDMNIVLWKWSDKAPSRLTLIDDEHRLSR